MCCRADRQMGVTGSNSDAAMSSSLPELITRIQSFTPVPLAVGFGVDNRTHFDFVTSAGADGVVIGSKLIKIIFDSAKNNQAPSSVEAFCREISLKGQEKRPLNRPKAEKHNHNHDAEGQPSPPLPIPAVTENPMEKKDQTRVTAPGKLPSRFGIFGGAYVPESLIDCLNELEAAYVKASQDPEFWKEFEDMFGYMNRPSELYLAERLTEKMGGAQIWLKWVMYRPRLTSGERI
jgi:tryptophan synthase